MKFELSPTVVPPDGIPADQVPHGIRCEHPRDDLDLDDCLRILTGMLRAFGYCFDGDLVVSGEDGEG